VIWIFFTLLDSVLDDRKNRFLDSVLDETMIGRRELMGRHLGHPNALRISKDPRTRRWEPSVGHAWRCASPTHNIRVATRALFDTHSTTATQAR
jgi:hypothetical protein